MMEWKRCPYCNEVFHGSSKQIYCSKKCVNNHSNEHVKSKKKHVKKGKSLTELAVEARQHGMTYGQYVAMLEGNGEKDG